MGAGDKYFQEGAVAVEDIRELFKIMRENTAAIAGVDKKITELCATVNEREKSCVRHNNETTSHDRRINSLELWKAAQEGTGAFMWKIGPMIIAAGSLGVALYIASHR